jgi:hypothetical protein
MEEKKKNEVEIMDESDVEAGTEKDQKKYLRKVKKALLKTELADAQLAKDHLKEKRLKKKRQLKKAQGYDEDGEEGEERIAVLGNDEDQSSEAAEESEVEAPPLKRQKVEKQKVEKQKLTAEEKALKLLEQSDF